MAEDRLLPELLTSLQSTVKLQAALMAKFEQREERMQANFDLRMQLLQSEVIQLDDKIDSIVRGASSQITKNAKDVVTSVAAQHSRDTSAAFALLRKADRTVWIWFAVCGAILILALLVGWTMLDYYRRELSSSKEELQRYESAVAIVQAFYASDVVICAGRICANEDPSGQRVGSKSQYRRAKPRP
ncbi:hypothetical protein [Ottowia sp.]|uniref:hypothetical protein n=1 Tax=Ottowia sp. TaxID=1898956 RepID=UPI003A8AA15B